MNVLYDVQGVQSRAHSERGIARYLLESALALERWHPGAVRQYLLNPDLAVPRSIEPLTLSGRLQLSDRAQIEDAAVYHVGSPIELDVPLHRLWPRAAQKAGVRLVATLYDLIPRVFQDVYLKDPFTQRSYDSRLELIRRADRILAISASTARDALDHLGVDPARVVVVGTGVSDQFRPADDPASPLAEVQASLPQIEPGFILYTGGIEPRKNIDGLLKAHAALGEDLRSSTQLVVVCRVLPRERKVLDRMLADLGIEDRVVFTGFVSDELLVALYRATGLFVFPSLYEGFGLPVAEAIACGAPVAVSRIPALTELIDEPAAQFDPRDPRSIAECVTRCLSDGQLMARLRGAELPDSATWRSVADRTVEAYETLTAAGPRSRRQTRRLRVGFVTPLPPQRSGVADDSYRLLDALSKHVEVDAFVDGEPQQGRAPDGVRVVGARSFHTVEALEGDYDRVFYCLGNSEFHVGALSLLRERPGIVIAHDVRLTGFYGWLATNRPELLPDGFRTALRVMYGNRLPWDLGTPQGIDFWDADRHGVLMAREAIALSEAFLVHSTHAAELARLDAAPGDERKVEVIPFRFPTPEEPSLRESDVGREPIIATFGLVSPAKQTERLVEAWPLVVDEIPNAKLAIVGSDAESGEAERIHDRLEELGVRDSVIQTGHVDESTFEDWVSRSAMAVQLRAASNGESSAVVARCLASGVPTIVTAIGAARELPDAAVVKVDRDISAPTLATTIVGLLRAEDRRASLSRSAQALARENSYELVARLLFERYVAGLRLAA